MPLDDVRTTPAPPHAQTARSMLLRLAETTGREDDRLLACSALAQLDDVHPPYPPASPAATTLHGAALVDETIAALITAVEQAGSAAERARAVLAIEAFMTPLSARAVP